MKTLSLIKIRDITQTALLLDKIVKVTNTVGVAKKINVDPSTLYSFRKSPTKIKIETLDKLFTYFQKNEPIRLKLAIEMYKKNLTIDDALDNKIKYDLIKEYIIKGR